MYVLGILSGEFYVICCTRSSLLTLVTLIILSTLELTLCILDAHIDDLYIVVIYALYGIYGLIGLFGAFGVFSTYLHFLPALTSLRKLHSAVSLNG